ncbi:MAG: (Fe-S)-binding protein [Thermodesulfovibrionales bacterium]
MNTPVLSGKIARDIGVCSRCGGCKAVCPTYDDSPIESRSARGRIMIVKGLLAGALQPDDAVCERIYSCTLCGACTGLCPLGIDIPEIIHAGRSFLRPSDRKRLFLRRAIRISTRWPDMSLRLLRISRHLVLPALAKRGLIPFSPELPETTLRAADQVYTVPRKKGRVAVFAGCSVNFFLPSLGESLINVLQHLGYEVVLPKDEVCCGAPLRSLGLNDEAEAAARKNERVLNRLKVEAILSLCPTCTMNLRSEYPKIIGRRIDRIEDVSVFLQERIPAINPIGRSAVFHDPCHLAYGLGVKKEPRLLIAQSGLDLKEPEKTTCCGFGGTFCFSNREIADRLLAQQARNLLQTGAGTVVTSCPGCMAYLGQAITDRPVLHLIELIEDAFCWRAGEAAAGPAKPVQAA